MLAALALKRNVNAPQETPFSWRFSMEDVPGRNVIPKLRPMACRGVATFKSVL